MAKQSNKKYYTVLSDVDYYRSNNKYSGIMVVVNKSEIWLRAVDVRAMFNIKINANNYNAKKIKKQAFNAEGICNYEGIRSDCISFLRKNSEIDNKTKLLLRLQKEINDIKAEVEEEEGKLKEDLVDKRKVEQLLRFVEELDCYIGEISYKTKLQLQDKINEILS